MFVCEPSRSEFLDECPGFPRAFDGNLWEEFERVEYKGAGANWRTDADGESGLTDTWEAAKFAH